MDLFRPGAEDLAEAAEALRRAAARDLGDFFSFRESGTEVSTDDGDTGAKLRFNVPLGQRKVGGIAVDLVVRRTPTSEPTIARLQPAVPLDWPDDWPDISLYPLADHLADKICAMYEWHSGGTRASTRCRDLADLLLIAQQDIVEGSTVQKALVGEQRRRTSAGIDLRLPNEFKIPDPAFWATNYPAAAAEVIGLIGHRTLTEATQAADLFVTPLLSGKDPGTWVPQQRRWTKQDFGGS